MKYFISLIIFYSYIHALAAQEQMSVEQIMASFEVFKNPDKKPTFPSCHGQEDTIYQFNFCADSLMHDFIYDNLQYPVNSLENGIEESVSLSILVEKDGTISECIRTNVSNQTPELTEEAIRIVRSMPRWEPAEVRGIKVRSTKNVGIQFKIKDGAMERPLQVDLRKMFSRLRKLTAEHKSANSKSPPFDKNKETANSKNKSTVNFTAPIFSGCEDEKDYQKRQKCTDTQLAAFIGNNRIYPIQAKKNNVEGMVKVKFIIEKDGSLTNVEIVNDIGSGCGEEALRLVKMMPKWEPATQRGRPIRVPFHLPINFYLD